ncbi:hypothetical protein FGL74_02455 [Leuconostoc koreense]|nr:hypothetical protein FGL74_02455 [Leuconostoc mesenteroides]
MSSPVGFDVLVFGFDQVFILELFIVIEPVPVKIPSHVLLGFPDKFSVFRYKLFGEMNLIDELPPTWKIPPAAR